MASCEHGCAKKNGFAQNKGRDHGEVVHAGSEFGEANTAGHIGFRSFARTSIEEGREPEFQCMLASIYPDRQMQFPDTRKSIPCFGSVVFRGRCEKSPGFMRIEGSCQVIGRANPRKSL